MQTSYHSEEFDCRERRRERDLELKTARKVKRERREFTSTGLTDFIVWACQSTLSRMSTIFPRVN